MNILVFLCIFSLVEGSKYIVIYNNEDCSNYNYPDKVLYFSENNCTQYGRENRFPFPWYYSMRGNLIYSFEDYQCKHYSYINDTDYYNKIISSNSCVLLGAQSGMAYDKSPYPYAKLYQDQNCDENSYLYIYNFYPYTENLCRNTDTGSVVFNTKNETIHSIVFPYPNCNGNPYTSEGYPYCFQISDDLFGKMFSGD